MIEYIYAGIALGSIYAIATSGLVVTYVSSGVLNFSFGSMAYFLARFFYFLNTQHGWGALPAALVSIGLGGALMGALLYGVLFRHLRLASSLIKIVSTIGLSVALPPLANTMFGNDTINTAPGLATAPVRVYKIFGASATLDQVIAVGCVLAVVVVGTLILQFTDAGLRVRAMVDSEALTSLSGVNPGIISVTVWMVSCSLAGLAGVLAAPTSGLSAGGMTALMASSFAAVVAARLRSLPVGVAAAMGMGLVTEISQKYLPANSSLTSAIQASIPVFIIIIFLLGYLAISGQVNEAASTGGALDAAIRPQGGDNAKVASANSVVAARSGWSLYMLGPVVVIAIIALLPMLLTGVWLTLLTGGLALSIVFLSFTMVMGEGGMIWLCQASFAGVGALTAAQLATIHGWNVLLAVLAGGVLAVPIGVVIGLLTIRLGNLYVALVTLSFGLLADTLLFTRDFVSNQSLGVTIARPAFLNDDKNFAYFTLAVFVILALFVTNLRRSTTGLALAAVRYSEPGARTLGLSTLTMKLIASGVSTFIAAIGGGFFALQTGTALPTDYATFTGLVWMAVLVTVGVRSVTAAILAGVSFTLLPGVFQSYLPVSWGNVPTILFGLGAVMVAINPDGQVAMNARQLQSLAVRISRRRAKRKTGKTPPRPGAAPTDPGQRGLTGARAGVGGAS